VNFNDSKAIEFCNKLCSTLNQFDYDFFPIKRPTDVNSCKKRQKRSFWVIPNLKFRLLSTKIIATTSNQLHIVQEYFLDILGYKRSFSSSSFSKYHQQFVNKLNIFLILWGMQSEFSAVILNLLGEFLRIKNKKILR